LSPCRGWADCITVTLARLPKAPFLPTGRAFCSQRRPIPVFPGRIVSGRFLRLFSLWPTPVFHPFREHFEVRAARVLTQTSMPLVFRYPQGHHSRAKRQIWSFITEVCAPRGMVPAFVSVVEETKTVCGFVTKRRQAITSEAIEKLNLKNLGH
jgi:hypothetical protein